MNDNELYRRRYEREKKARKAAELLLEEKSRELYQANDDLKKLAGSLEEKVQQRTHDLEIARDEAIQSNKVKSDFLTNLSHEIRTPLNGLIGALELLQLKDLPSEQQTYLSYGLSSGESLLSLINDVLDFSKIEAGKIELESISLQPKKIIQQAIDVIKASIEEKRLMLEVSGLERLPTHVVGDPTRIRQILTNLLGNALKFTDTGYIRVVSTYDGEGVLTVDVSDSGIGISDAQLSMIWDHFTQADNSITRRFGGTGLGLSISYRLSHLMGGELTVESQLGKGTTFRFQVPLEIDDRADEKKTAGQVRDQQQPKTAFATAKVLVVDDNAVNRMVAVALLESLGLDAVTAASGKDAIATVQEISFELILMDIQMPELDGVQTTAVIRELGVAYESLPIIALTAHALTGDKERYLASGMDGYLSKPVRRGPLFDLLCQYLETKSN